MTALTQLPAGGVITRRIREAVACIALVALAACGGGGGGGGGTPTPTPTAPSITTQPANASAADGGNASFSVVAAGTTPLTYQWQKNAANIAGATAATLNLTGVAIADNGAQYRVVVTNASGTVNSNAATLTVTAVAPTITTAPISVSVLDGQPATFTVVAAGSGPLTYQWQRNGTNISGATSTSYTVASAAIANSGDTFRVVVTNAVTPVTSAAATLTVSATPPAITSQPQAQTVGVGATATFSVSATGTAPLTFQWRKGGVNIVGATSSSYTTPATVLGDNGSVFTVVVNNASNTPVTSSGATLGVNTSAPSITTHPSPVSTVEGTAAVFTVVANGTAPLAYQWQRDTVNIPGATNASYTLAQPTPLDSLTMYRVVVTNGSGTATSNAATLTVTRAPISLVAGKLGGAGSVDGTGTAAQLFNPAATAVDNSGNIYVADRANHTIRKITPAGVVTTIAGQAGVPGYVDDVGTAARFNFPRGIAVASNGVIYVADTDNNVIRRILTDGTVETYAGTGTGGSTDGPRLSATFSLPRGVAVRSNGEVFVADTNNHTIRAIGAGGTVTTLAGAAGTPGFADGLTAAARFNYPAGISVDDVTGDLYVADTSNNRIRAITPAGSVTTFAGEGNAFNDDGPAASASFNFPEGVVIDACNDVYVADTLNDTIRKIAGGNVTTVAGTAGNSGATDASGAAASFNRPLGIASNACSSVYVADSNNNLIRKVVSNVGTYPVTTLAGNIGGKGFADGTALAARFNDVRGVAVDPTLTTYYAADYGNSIIRKIVPAGAGTVTTLAGSALQVGNVDGDGSGARFDQPIGVAMDPTGADANIYVLDRATATVRRVTPGGTVTTIAGDAAGYTTGTTDGVGTAARFNDPRGIAYICGFLYIADFGNHTIRRMDVATGAVVTFAGAAGVAGSTNGTSALTARFNHPRGITKDGGCNLYVGEYDGNVVRWLSADGTTVTTVAGGTQGTADGVGAAAQFDGPTGIAYAGQGIIFVSDSRSHLLRKVDVGPGFAGATGTVTTLAGVPGSVGVTLGNLPGSLGSASGIAVINDTTDTLLVGESLENALLQITP